MEIPILCFLCVYLCFLCGKRKGEYSLPRGDAICIGVAFFMKEPQWKRWGFFVGKGFAFGSHKCRVTMDTKNHREHKGSWSLNGGNGYTNSLLPLCLPLFPLW